MPRPHWDLAYRIEAKFASLIHAQEQRGVRFDSEKAQEYLRFLDEEMGRLYSEIRPMLEPELHVPGKPVKEPFCRDGRLAKRAYDYAGESVWGPFTPVQFEEPDIQSRWKLMEQLKKHGWEAKEYTEKGNPRLTEGSLEGLGGVGEQIALWYKLSHRKSQIQGWVENVREDGRIEARCNPCGTPTARVTHRLVANVPAANKTETGALAWYPDGKTAFGTEMRSLFTVERGRRLVGADAAQLELRVLAHFMDDKELIRQVKEGDPHTHFWKACDDLVDSRSTMKNIEYALVYGAGDFKLGLTAGYGKEQARDVGKAIRSRIMEAFPALADLNNRVQRAAKRGYLVGLDGRKVWIRQEHKALNTLIQFTGSLAMKISSCYANQWNKPLDAQQVISYHDEYVWDVKESLMEQVGNNLERSMSKAGEFLELRCPLEGEYQVGQTWAEVH